MVVINSEIQSSNDYLCETAYRLGTFNGTKYADNTALGKLQEYADLFYLDRKSGIETAESQPHVTDAYGIPSAIGQGKVELPDSI